VTWILGYSSPFGYAVGLSDIRVTFSKAEPPIELDCLQKIHGVGPFMALGFSGSVRIGFGQVARLRAELGGLQVGQAWIPEEVVTWLPEVLREEFQSHPIAEMENRCDLILFTAHPTQHDGNPSWPRCSIYIFRSPNFADEQIPRLQVAAIGSGNGIEAHREILREFTERPFDLMRMETAGSGMGISLLEMTVTSELRKKQPAGISSHLHLCFVRRGSIEFQQNDYISYDHDGTAVPFEMPRVATTYAGYHELLKTKGLLPGLGIA
jgi:hypothetical protein